MASDRVNDRCALCGVMHPPRALTLKDLPEELGGELPSSLQEQACTAWEKRSLPLVATGKLCSDKCWRKMLRACKRKPTATMVQPRSSTSTAAPPPGYVHTFPVRPSLVATAALLRFDRALAAPPRAPASYLAGWEQLDGMVSQTVARPWDADHRAQIWQELLILPPTQSPVRWVETLQAMGGDDLGPPLLLDSKLASIQTADNFTSCRERLLALGSSCVLHEIVMDGHALDPLGKDGCHVAERSLLDLEVTKHRFPLINSAPYGNEVLGPLRDRFGWADPDISQTCRLLEHPEHAPLIVWQQHEKLPGAAAGEETAPVLMYAPSLPKVLPEGHPGRVALERLEPAAGESWMKCQPLLPPDHSMSGQTLDQIVKQLSLTDKAAGHGHGFERLVSSHFNGVCCGQTSVPQYNTVLDDSSGEPPAKRRRGKYTGVKVRRPLIGHNGVLEWNDASSALQFGTVSCCIPAAEAALHLLPVDHPCRSAHTRLAPYGRVWSYCSMVKVSSWLATSGPRYQFRHI